MQKKKFFHALDNFPVQGSSPYMNKEPFIQLSSLGINGIKGGLKNNLFTSGKDQITGYSSRHCAQVWEGTWVARQNLDVLNRSLVSKR